MLLNQFTEDELYRICAGAEFLAERIENGLTSSELPHNENLGAFRRERWLNSAVAGDSEIFNHLLNFQGLDLDSCAHHLQPRLQRISSTDCSWFGRLKKTLAQLLDRNEDDTRPSGASLKYPLPFEEIFYLTIIRSEQELDELFHSKGLFNITEIIHPSARKSMRRALLTRLCGLSSEVFYRYFDYHRSSSNPKSSLPYFTNTESQGIYEELIKKHRVKLIREAMLNFPVMARLICLAIDQWIEASSEIMIRLSSDIKLIRSKFEIQSDSYVTDISSLGSDPHMNGRSAWVITFSNSKRIVYKPRSLAQDAAWMNWLKWLTDHGAPPSAGSLTVCDQDTYGWMEWVEDTPLASNTDEFFLRFGATLCLAHLFNANDLHYENVVVSSATPYIVDLETLFHPRDGLREDEDKLDAGERAARISLRNTVAWTKLLPSWMSTSDLDTFPIGALNPREMENVVAVRFVDANTDHMRIERVTVDVPDTKSLPQKLAAGRWSWQGAPLLCMGFEAMWKFITTHRSLILDDQGPLKPFRDTKVRVLLKATQVYFFSLKRSLSAEFLVDGGVWTSQHQILYRFLDKAQNSALWFSLMQAESHSLSRLDIPYFSVPCSGNTLYCDGSPVLKNAFFSSPFLDVCNRIYDMTSADMKAQSNLIKQSVLALEESAQSSAVYHNETTTCHESQVDFLEAACDIGNLILNSSVNGEGLFWVGLAPIVRTRHRQIESVGLDLYSGNSGIALFYAALAAATKDGKWTLIAQQALAPVLAMCRDSFSAKRMARALGIGAGTGFGGIAYALTRIGDLLKNEDYYRCGLTVANYISPELIARERNIDALSGLAGAIFGLISVAAKTRDTWPIDRAIMCGERLLALAETRSDGIAFRRNRDKEIEFGIAHGVAGICLSLYKLGAATGLKKYTDTAISGLSFEYASENKGSYYHTLPKELSHDVKTALAYRWCRGASGLALANLILSNASQNNASVSIYDFKRKFDKHLLSSEDNLCCGNFGRIEYLLSAGLHLHDKNLVHESQEAAARVVKRRISYGGFSTRAPDALNPGFFTGISGIGYQILRVGNPASFPNILSWD